MSPITDKKQEIIMTRRGAPKKLSEETQRAGGRGVKESVQEKNLCFLNGAPLLYYSLDPQSEHREKH